MRLDQLATEGRSKNNFDVLRLIAAELVLFAHSFDLLREEKPFDKVGWGYLGVVIFFGISGFLVCRSWDLNPRIGSFAAKRALRLMPGLIVALLFTALIIGPLVTTLPVADYLRDGGTKAYIINNASLQVNYALPGVFTENLYPGAVNGSLWTLAVEVKAYLLLALVGLVGLLVRRREVFVLFAIYGPLAALATFRLDLPGFQHYQAFLQDIQMPTALVDAVGDTILELNVRLVGAFAIGAGLYTLRKWIPILWPIAGALFAWLVATIIWWPEHTSVVLMAVTPYIVLTIAYRTSDWFHLPSWWGDYSYGIYIYAFPVQQLVSYWFAPMSPWLLFIVASLITLGLAALSWHFVEKPALRLKNAFGGSTAGTQPAVAAAPAPG